MIVFENFFDNPDEVRQYALSLKYNKHPGGVPGKRTDNIRDLNSNIFETFQMKLLNILYGSGQFEVNINAFFQLTPAHYEEGWVHTDNVGLPNEPTVAGVIYLTPNAPLSAGTSIYSGNPYSSAVPINHNIKIDFYQDKEVDMSEYRLERDRNNALYTKTVDVANIYNRLLVYNTTQLHRENMFFGTTNEDSRMTLVFFALIERIQ